LNPDWLHAAVQAAAGSGKAFAAVHTDCFVLHGFPTPQAQVKQVCGAAEAVCARSAEPARPAPKIFSAWRRDVAWAMPRDIRSSIFSISSS
jgi:hypothetical protein